MNAGVCDGKAGSSSVFLTVADMAHQDLLQATEAAPHVCLPLAVPRR